MPTNSKELARALFAGKPVSRPPFIPYIATAAARFMQVPIKQMFSDPTTLANSLQACQRLFKYDGIVILFDTSLEAEACGCQIEWPEGGPPIVVSHILQGKSLESLDISSIDKMGRIPAVLEAASRLAHTVGKDVALLGAVTGPLTVSKHLVGDDFIHMLSNDALGSQKVLEQSAKIAIAMVRAYGELKFDAIVLIDGELASLYPIYYPRIQVLLKTLRNLANFYEMPLLVLTKRIHPVPVDRFAAFMKFEADGFSLGNQISELSSLPLPGSRFFGRCIAKSALLGPPEAVDKAICELLDKSIGSRFFLTTEWEVPPNIPALNLHRVMQVLTRAPAS